jgi:biotin-dependent carboxylase-like uncharacterized protein
LKTIKIINAGPQTTIQDQGRFGFQDRGVPVSGAMDQEAYRLGNLLVGNQGHEASLEITLGGFKAEFLSESCFCLTGAEGEARLNNQSIRTWTAHRAVPGDVLSLDYGRKGGRWYLALAGGIDIPLVLGSRSTYLRGGFGGLEGRPLRKGDQLETGRPMGQALLSPLPGDLIPGYSQVPVIRVVMGPQDEAITEHGLSTFLNAPYTVTQRSDRMGCLLEGPPIEHKQGPDIISDATAFGSIQVPGSGQPIILMADRQTVGGYVKIATVVSVDLPLIAQSLPGHKVRFQAVPFQEAQSLLVERKKRQTIFFRLGVPKE